MKKEFFAAAVSALLLISGCTADSGAVNTAAPAASAETAAPSEQTAAPSSLPAAKLIQANDATTMPEDWSTVTEYSYDIDRDGERETIRLGTDAQIGDDGLVEFDDSNNFILEMADTGNVFELYNGRIQLGTPYFEVYEDADGIVCIAFAISSGSGHCIEQFRYIKEKKAFEQRTIIDENNINVLYRSMGNF